MINVTIKPKLYIKKFSRTSFWHSNCPWKAEYTLIFFYAHLYNPLDDDMCNVCYGGGGGGFSISVWLSTKIKTEISSAPLIFLWRRQWWNASTVVHMSDSPCITRRTGHCSHLTPLSLRWRLILRGFSSRIYIQPTSRNIYTIIVNRAQFTVVYCTHDSNKNVLFIIK